MDNSVKRLIPNFEPPKTSLQNSCNVPNILHCEVHTCHTLPTHVDVTHNNVLSIAIEEVPSFGVSIEHHSPGPLSVRQGGIYVL